MSAPGADPWGVADASQSAGANEQQPWIATEDQAAEAIRGIDPNAQIPSQYRDQAHNAEVGGVANSLHTRGGGQAADVVLSPRVTPQAFRAQLEAQGYPVTEFLVENKGDPHSTGYHVHWGWGPKNGAAPAANDPWGVSGQDPWAVAGAAPAAKEMPKLGALPGKLFLDKTIAPQVPAGAPRPFAPGEYVQNPDGSWSSEISVTVTNPKLNGGKATNLPSLWIVNGKPVRVSEDQAAAYALKSGLEWPSFGSIKEADAAASARETKWQGMDQKQARAIAPLWTKPESSWADIAKDKILQAWPSFKQQMLGLADWAVQSGPPSLSDVNPAFSPSEDDTTDLQKESHAAAVAAVKPWFDRTRKDIGDDIAANAPQVNEGSLKDYTAEVIGGTINMVPALAVGMVTKNPVIAAGIIGAQAGGGRYTAAIESGRTPEQASVDAGFDAMVNGAMGALPIHVLMKPGGTFLAKTLKSVGAFTFQSVATEAIQFGYDKGIINPDMPLSDVWPRLERAGIIGALTGGLLGGTTHGIERAAAAFRAKTPQGPAERVEPGPASTTPEAAAARPPTREEEMLSSIGLKHPGEAPKVDPWGVAPSNEVAKSDMAASEPVENVNTPPEEPSFRTTPAQIAAEHELQMQQLAREGGAAAEAKHRPQIPEEAPAEVPFSQSRHQPEGPVTEHTVEELARLGREQGIARRNMESDVAITASGREVPVQYAVVEASSLVPSQTAEGHPNPAFPAELQPRDRTRAVSQNQIAQIAQNLNPRLLDRSANAGDGAPIIAQSGIVESGNGRSLALQRAYSENLPSAERYREHLKAQGYPVDGMQHPVLVRVRTGEMTPEDRQSFVREANQSNQMGYSATERAMADASALPHSALDLYRGGDVESAANRDFVRAFLSHAVPENEHAGMISREGALSQEAVRRVRAALLAKAYGDPDFVSAIVEDQDTNIKAIGGALTDAAADWAKMRAMADSGEIPPTLDQTGKLLEAVNLVGHARQSGRNVAELVGQRDIFTGDAVDPDVEGWLRLMFRNIKDWTQPVGRDKLAEALRNYAQEAQKAQVGINLFGQEAAGPREMLAVAKRRQYGEPSEAGASLPLGAGLRDPGAEGDGPLFERTETGGGAGSSETGDQNRNFPVVGRYGPRPARFDFEHRGAIVDVNLTDEAQRYISDARVNMGEPVKMAGTLANYVLQRGRHTGFETLAIAGIDGKVLARTSSRRSSVAFNEIEPVLRDPNQRIMSFHNHPSSMGPSGGDLESLGYPGHAYLVVTGHDGDWHGARLKGKRNGDPERVAFAMKNAYTEAAGIARRTIDPLFKAGILGPDPASHLYSHAIMAALDAGGYIDYKTSRVPPKAGENALRSIVEEFVRGIPFTQAIAPGLRVTPAEGPYRPADPVQFKRGMEDVFAFIGRTPGSAGSAPGAPAGDRAPQPYRKPEQLRLLEEERRFQDSPAFRAWFGDSKVVDSGGKPRVVYHGTPSRRAIGQFKTPAYFTDQPSFAEMFAGERGENRGAIYPVYLKIEHPYEIDAATDGRHFEWDAQDVARMKAEGHDGVIVKGGEDESDIYTPFDPNQIKSVHNAGAFNPRKPGILQEDEKPFKAPAFYSALGRSITDAKLTRGPAKDWLGFVDNLKNKGVKQEEIDWSGIKDWLASKTGPVTKGEVEQFLRDNEVQVTDVTLGDLPAREDTKPDARAEAEYGERWNRIVDERRALQEQKDSGRGPVSPADLRREIDRKMDALDELHDQMVDDTLRRLVAASDVAGKTKYHQYALPGGENYRELLLTLPPSGEKGVFHVEGDGKGNWHVKNARGETVTTYGNEAYARSQADEYNAKGLPAHIASRAGTDDFQSGHFDQPNILAHIRFDDRTGPDGEKTLHIAEVQSDWHQQGRRGGYHMPLTAADNAKIAELEVQRKAAEAAVERADVARWRAHNEEPKGTAAQKTDLEVAHQHAVMASLQIMDEIGAIKSKTERNTPNAPFKQSWHEIAMKRMLRYAAEHGYDRVTWDSGDTQADRYDLSKHIDRIVLNDNSSGGIGSAKMEGPFEEGNLTAYGKDGSELIQRYVRSPKEIVDAIGKDAADKLLAVTPLSKRTGGMGVRQRRLENADLKMGGEGMRGFYDRILPQFMAKYVKKWGGKVSRDHMAKIKGLGAAEARQLGATGKAPHAIAAVHAIDVTLAMRESVMQGQALFEDEKPFKGEPRAIDFEHFAAERGASRQDFGDAGLHRGSRNQSHAARARNIKNQADRDTQLGQRRNALRDEYDAAVARGEVRPLSRTERLVQTARGHEDNESVQAARRLLEKQGVEWREKKYAEEPGAVDAKDNPLPQLIIPGAERSAAQLAKARESIGKGLKTTSKTQKEAGGMFGPGVGDGKQGSLFDERRRYQLPGALSDVPTTRPQPTLADHAKDVAARTLDIIHDGQMLLSPMATGTPEARAAAKDFASTQRAARFHGQFMDESLKKNFTPAQRKRMWEAADEESVARQTGQPTADIGLSRLTPEERRAVLEQQADAQNVWDAAKKMGMVEGEGLPSYVPRMMVEMATTGGLRSLGHNESLRSIPGIGRNMRTSTGQMKHRKYLTAEETERAGSERFGTLASVVKDIRTLPLATMRLREAVAGRALIERVRQLGNIVGEETVSEGILPIEPNHNWFTINHPAFKTWRTKLAKDAETGKWKQITDQDGNPQFEQVPIYVRGDFEGPLRAVLTTESGKIYQGAMALKGKVMNSIMFSPLVQLHLLTELGRAFPAAPFKVATLRILSQGGRVLKDPAKMTRFIMAGMVPITHGASNDISSIAAPDNIVPGRGWTADIAGAIPGLFSRAAGDAVKRAVDKMGDVLHNTLLWHQVAKLQAGLAETFSDHLISKGFSQQTADRMGAHWANRYAGTLPAESMSSMARKIANLTLFSRTYTLGNLAVVKDMVTGLPRDVQAQIQRDMGSAELKRANSYAKRKTIAIIALDVALIYAANSILQNLFAYFSGRQTGDEIWQGYVDRLRALGEEAKQNPLAIANPFTDAEKISATAENEIDPDTGMPLKRILVGYDKEGTAIYARNPVGKFGEEYANWAEAPLATFKSKLSTFVRPALDVLANDNGFHGKIYLPTDSSVQAAAKVATHFMEEQLPMDQIQGAADVLTGNTEGLSATRLGLRTVGVTVRHGARGGPVVGELRYQRELSEAKTDAAMPAITKKIRDGDIKGARADMRALKIDPGYQAYIIRTTKNPKLRLLTKKNRALLRDLPPEERARIQRMKESQP